jgi:hypothetical protein
MKVRRDNSLFYLFAGLGKNTQNVSVIGKVTVYIHAVVKNTYDFNPFCGLTIKDEMSSHMVLEISFTDVIASAAPLGFP